MNDIEFENIPQDSTEERFKVKPFLAPEAFQTPEAGRSQNDSDTGGTVKAPQESKVIEHERKIGKGTDLYEKLLMGGKMQHK